MKSITEVWTPVLINGGIFKDTYLVSNMGRVKYKRMRRDGSCSYPLLRIINGKRPSVRLTGNGKRYTKSVAKLVLSSFQYREGCECANVIYLDGNMKNCALSNLRYRVDNSIYIEAQLKKKEIPVHKVEKRPVLTTKVLKNPLEKKVVEKLCKYCAKNPCFEGLENLSSTFEDCVDYKPRQTE